MVAALLLGVAADDASAAALGAVASSFGLLAALSAVVLLKAWQAHPLVGGLSTVFGILAFAAGVALLRRPRSPLGQVGMAQAPGSAARADAVGPQSILLPAGVDRQVLLGEMRWHFVELQAAWDNNARDRLLEMTTPGMLEELCAARTVGFGPAHRTEVMTLEVNLVAFEALEAAQLVCVEFSGMIRESSRLAAAPFREIWILTRANDVAAQWRLARHQAML